MKRLKTDSETARRAQTRETPQATALASDVPEPLRGGAAGRDGAATPPAESRARKNPRNALKRLKTDSETGRPAQTRETPQATALASDVPEPLRGGAVGRDGAATPSAKSARPEKSPQRLEKAQNGLGHDNGALRPAGSRGPRPSPATTRPDTASLQSQRVGSYELGLPGDWGCGRRSGNFASDLLIGGRRVAWIVRLVKTGADGERQCADVLKINRPDDLGDIANLGLTLAEGKLLLAGLQQEIVAAQAKGHAVRRPDCRSCGEVCRVKDYRDHAVATLFGQVTVRLPRFRCAGCGGNEAGHGWPSYCRSTPELDQLQAHLSALMTYRVAADVLRQMFPVDAGNNPETLRLHTLKIGAELRDQAAVRPDPAASSITVTLDSTFIRGCEDGERHLEVRIGNVETETGGRQVFGAVARADTDIKVLIRRSLDAVGRTEDTALTAFTDGCSGLRRILADAGVTETPVLDWFHIAMRLQHLEQTAGGLSADDPARVAAKAVIVAEVERLQWRLWNGKAKDADISIGRIRTVMHHFQGEQGQPRSIAPSRKLWTALHALDAYLTGQSDWLVNYAERYRAGLRVGTAITEGTANFLVNRRMNKSQQMRWSRRGADLLLQVRSAVYNGTLCSGFGQRFQPANDPLPQAAVAA